MKKKRIGLFFGSFNPIHHGHLIIANYMVTRTDLDEVWFVVSPHNPLKKRSSLAPARERLHLIHLAIEDNYNLRPCDIELYLPQPSYTVDTLVHLKEKYPNKEFVLIMGGDNLSTLPKWKNHEILLRDYEVYVYARPEYEFGELGGHPSIKIFKDVPQMHISSSYIRQCINEGYSIEYLVPKKVEKHLLYWNIYN